MSHMPIKNEKSSVVEMLMRFSCFMFSFFKTVGGRGLGG